MQLVLLQSWHWQCIGMQIVSTCVEVSIVGIGVVEVSSISVAVVANAVIAKAHIEVTVVATAA